MSRNVTEFRVFVASPSDVQKEVERLEDTIERLNAEWDSQAVRLRLVRWQTHVNPGLGTDAQAVVNAQMPTDYDVFVGIMWARAGTPTDRAESGTIEEFWRAKARHDEDPDSVSVMFYFKEAAIPLQADPKQLQAVQSFRAEFQEGGLYSSFETAEEFERQVHMHLTRYLQENRGSGAVVSLPVEPSGDHDEPNPGSDDAEPGFLDLEEEFEKEFKGVREASEEIAAAITELGEMTTHRIADLERAQQQPNFEAIKRRVLRNIMDNAAAGMDRYVEKAEKILPRFSAHLDRGVTAFSRAIPMFGQVSNRTTAAEREELKAAVSGLRESLGGAADSLEGFKTSVAETPPLTRAMTRSRRATAAVLQSQIDAMRRAQKDLEDIEGLIDDIPVKRLPEPEGH